MFELGNKVSSDFVRDLSLNPDISRVPEIGLLYSELVQGIPPIFRHFIDNIKSVHSVLVFISFKSIPISKVAMEERFLFRQVEPRDYRMFRCVVRYGYNNVIEEPKEFERLLIDNLKEFIGHDHFIREGSVFLREQMEDQPAQRNNGSFRVSSASIQSLNNIVAVKSGNFSSRMVSGPIQGAEEEMQFVQKAMDNGVVYLLGETEVRAQQNSSLLKKIVVNYAYNFLRKNSRQGEKVMAIPRNRLLRVGMTYEI
ncbi:high affinity K+ transporter 5 [Actinidia rufa]|uniref:High affinity K+ transporter 5 n=1 Tax=Actinidia rufa TaxID=165716 RepID=A0A7J0ETA9_9ERIC|nr:high affinity K+ transporter 5 [Actinidia rufa]